uniref:Uncharacterized protein n=1 Tax=Vitis vinifera TaxID=29760 RepID=F6H083_VITVI
MAHGQRIEFVPKLPLVIGDLATSIESVFDSDSIKRF